MLKSLYGHSVFGWDLFPQGTPGPRVHRIHLQSLAWEWAEDPRIQKGGYASFFGISFFISIAFGTSSALLRQSLLCVPSIFRTGQTLCSLASSLLSLCLHGIIPVLFFSSHFSGVSRRDDIMSMVILSCSMEIPLFPSLLPFKKLKYNSIP